MAPHDLQEELRKPDEFVSAMSRALAWAALRTRLLSVAALAVLLVVAGFFAWQGYHRKDDLKAADEFHAIARSFGLAGGGEPGPAQEGERDWKKIAADLDAFLTAHPHSSLTPSAWLLKGRALLAVGQAEAALEAYRSAGRKLSGSFADLATEGEAHALTELTRFDEAEAAFRGLAAKKDNPLRALHLWNLGQTQEARGRGDEALKSYRSFESEFPTSPYLERVRARIAVLTRK